MSPSPDSSSQEELNLSALPLHLQSKLLSFMNQMNQNSASSDNSKTRKNTQQGDAPLSFHLNDAERPSHHADSEDWKHQDDEDLSLSAAADQASTPHHIPSALNQRKHKLSSQQRLQQQDNNSITATSSNSDDHKQSLHASSAVYATQSSFISKWRDERSAMRRDVASRHQQNQDSNQQGPKYQHQIYSCPTLTLPWDTFQGIEEELFQNGIAIVDDFLTEQNSQQNLLHNFLKFDLKRMNLTNGRIALDSKLDVSKRGDVHSFINVDSQSTARNKSKEDSPAKFSSSNLKGIIDQMRNLPLLLNDLYDCAFDHDSIQVAVYQGDGKRYVKHADATPFNAPERRLTMLLYLNDPSEINGGDLKFYMQERSLHTPSVCDASTTKGIAERLNGRNGVTVDTADQAILVKPLFNRLVVFFSDYYHEVLPSYFTRKAITLWCYSKKDVHSVLRPRFSSTLPRIESEVHTARIFVSICSYRDPECGPTVRDLFEKARFPSRLRVGINWQYNEKEDVRIFDGCSYYGSKYAPQIREIRMPHGAAKGPVYARALIQKLLFEDEEFYLQIDSHMRFEENWDVRLIRMLQQVEKTSGNDRCVLSTYPAGYELPNQIPEGAQVTLLAADRFVSESITADFSYEMLRLRGKSVMMEINHPLETYFWAAGYSFSRASMVREVPYETESSEYVFFGEEILMALRLHTAGYQIFAPNDILAYHLWSRDYRSTFRENEREIGSPEEGVTSEEIQSLVPLVSRVERRNVPPRYLHADSPSVILQKKKRNLHIVMQRLGMEGSISSDSVKSYELLSGVNFLTRRINSHGSSGGFDLPQYLL